MKKEEKKTPKCSECSSAVMESFKEDGVACKNLIGCKENFKIRNYPDAERLCPILKC